MDRDLLEILACPICKGELLFDREKVLREDGTEVCNQAVQTDPWKETEQEYESDRDGKKKSKKKKKPAKKGKSKKDSYYDEEDYDEEYDDEYDEESASSIER